MINEFSLELVFGSHTSFIVLASQVFSTIDLIVDQWIIRSKIKSHLDFTQIYEVLSSRDSLWNALDVSSEDFDFYPVQV